MNRPVVLSQRDTPRVQQAREAYVTRMAEQSAKRLKFIDEAGVHQGLTRLYGRAAPDQRVVEGMPGYLRCHQRRPQIVMNYFKHESVRYAS